jgi:large subunit ribosomal protein L25
MEQKNLEYTVRTERKKGPARRLRREGKIPSILYGHSKPLPIVIDRHELHTKFKGISESTIITLQSGEETHEVLVKDYQEDLVRDEILHIDFYEIEKGKLLKTHVPVHLVGTALGVKEGGILEILSHELEVECLPKDLPEALSVDISTLDLGQSIHVRDMDAEEGVRFLTPGDQVVCTIARKRIEVEEVAEEEVEEEAEEEIEEEE